MHFILYSAITRGTGNQLAQRLGIQGGETAPDEPLGLLIRWGSSASVPKNPVRVLNKKDSVASAADKFMSLLKMRQEHVPVPNTLPITELLEFTLDEVTKKGLKQPIFARKPRHTRGKDILLCLQNRDLKRALRWGKTFLVEYVPTDREYRIHVFDGVVIRMSQKVLMSRDDYCPYMRNDDHNHTFRNPRQALTASQQEVAIAAVRALDLDFGAVDMVIGDDGNPYVLEVNTGPSLIDNGMDIYTEKFIQHIKALDNA